jgi:hypothetical protein
MRNANHSCTSPRETSRPMVAPYVNTSRFVTSQPMRDMSSAASKLVNPNLVLKKRLQFHKEISDVQISFAHKPHDQENLVIEVKCGSAQAPCLFA